MASHCESESTETINLDSKEWRCWNWIQNAYEMNYEITKMNFKKIIETKQIHLPDGISRNKKSVIAKIKTSMESLGHSHVWVTDLSFYHKQLHCTTNTSGLWSLRERKLMWWPLHSVWLSAWQHFANCSRGKWSPNRKKKKKVPWDGRNERRVKHSSDGWNLWTE